MKWHKWEKIGHAWDHDWYNMTLRDMYKSVMDMHKFPSRALKQVVRTKYGFVNGSYKISRSKYGAQKFGAKLMGGQMDLLGA